MTKIAISNLASENTFSELNLSEQEKINGGFLETLGLTFNDQNTDSSRDIEIANRVRLEFDDNSTVLLEAGSIQQNNSVAFGFPVSQG